MQKTKVVKQQMVLLAKFFEKFKPSPKMQKVIDDENIRKSDLLAFIGTLKPKIKAKAMKRMDTWGKLEAKRVELNNKLKIKLVEGKDRPLAAFVTFERIMDRDYMLSEFQLNPISRFINGCCLCCCKGYRKWFKGRVLNVAEAPAPRTIRWENIEKNSCNKMLRRLFSVGVTLLLLITVFVAMVFIRNYQEEKILEYPYI